MKYYYNRNGGKSKYGPIESVWDDESTEYIAEECAEDFYENQDGWEASWPINFYLFEDGKDDYFAVVEVHLDFTPTFTGVAP
jgi:hypothetical protein